MSFFYLHTYLNTIRLLLTYLLVTVSSLVIAQLTAREKKAIDSLKYVVNSTSDDSIRIHSYVRWDNIIYASDVDLDFDINVKIAKICADHLNKNDEPKRTGFYKYELSFAYNNIGSYFESTGNYLKGISFYEKSLKLSQEVDNLHGIVNAYNNLGNAYKALGDHETAIEHYKMALPYWEELDDDFGRGTTFNNIGIIFNEARDHDEARKYFNKSYGYFEKINDAEGLGLVTYNLALMYEYMGDLDSAIMQFEISLEYNLEVNFLARIGGIYAELANINVVLGDTATINGELGKARVFYQKAEENALKAYDYSMEALTVQDLPTCLFALYKAQKALGKYESSLENLEKYLHYSDLKDSLKNEKEYLHRKFVFEFETQALKDSLMIAEERKVTEQKLETEKTQRYALYGGIFLLLLFGGYTLSRFRKERSQKAIIAEQKAVVEEQHQEIKDSINYAQRIQAAILPPANVVDKFLKDCIVIYLPKDVVAGDFYWLQNVDGKPLFAAADCTGHGVPGAMVSVVCNNALNRSVKEFGLTDPGKILDKTREIVIEEFARSEQNVKDGMDISLCYLNGNKLQFAGANNGLWLIRNGEMISLKGDRQPVGNFDHQTPFTTHELKLQKGDTFYLFSDGIVDQFGGDKGKKFKTKGLKELLLSIQDQSMQDQKTAIVQAFHDWKGDHEQIDDVCLFGVKV